MKYESLSLLVHVHNTNSYCMTTSYIYNSYSNHFIPNLHWLIKERINIFLTLDNDFFQLAVARIKSVAARRGVSAWQDVGYVNICKSSPYSQTTLRAHFILASSWFFGSIWSQLTIIYMYCHINNHQKL